MLKVVTQKDILKKLTTLYTRAEHIKAYLSNEPFELSIKFKRLSQKDIEQNFLEVQKWIEKLNQSSFDIEFVEINYSSIGKQSIPKVLEINQEIFLKQLSKSKIFEHHKILIDQTIVKFPKLRELLISKPNLIILYDNVWIEILKVCEYFVANPKPNLYIRELDIEGVDTKFIENYKKVLDIFLSALWNRDISKLSQNGFEKKYGLKYDLPTIRFRILDKNLYIHNFSDISLPLNEFAMLDIACERVYITENKINGLSFPDISNSMVIFGLGYGVESLKNIEWLKSKEIYYWGDIDTHGFAILSQIRGYFPQVESILMDEEVIEKYRYLAVEEPKAKRFLGELDNLSLEEEKVFERLKSDDSLKGLRIEQERVPLFYLNNKI
ncbi:FIG005429: hypothetical protein [hydrothermal vent metagenome]|uniref:Wadjet protein JetD C-terminal domain-containing protein n=1 Tax=hydrothermal vent metagenome TaxID=652676 RepID=A0A1W1CJM8_9ZZZZ